MKTIQPFDLSTEIEKLINDHLAATRLQAEAALSRAFGTPNVLSPTRSQKRSPISREHRNSAQIDEIGERLLDLVAQFPGETMVVLAQKMDSKVPELRQPMVKLKKSGRVRSVGHNKLTRYFPVAGSSPAEPD